MPIDAPLEEMEGEEVIEPEVTGESVVQTEEDNDPGDAGAIDVKLTLSEEKKAEIVSYLEENLPNMKMSEKDESRIKSYLAMYDMAASRRDFPYENAPSIPSSDAYDKLNEWLDKAEVAFLITNGTFNIDREETAMDEQTIRRMEKTWHKKYFWGSGFAEELRLVLFEAGYLGGSILSVREEFNVEPVREKVVIKTDKDLAKYQSSISKKDYSDAQEAIANSKVYLAERDILKVLFAGAKIGRINQTRFFYPQNENDFKKWQIVSEVEFYTESDLLMMAEGGELDKKEVEKAIAKNRDALKTTKIAEEERRDLPENVMPNALDTSFAGNYKSLKTYGEAYENEYAIYRTTLKYKVPTKSDPNGAFRSWVEVIYCPSGGNILSSTFCKHGFPYFLVQFRPVPHKAIGAGIAQARYPYNLFDADMKSLFFACLEQEIGAPTLIKKDSGLWASGFRTYPGSIAYTNDPERDAKVFQMPEKSRLAVEGMKIALGSSPSANKGAGYSSGKREELLMEQKNVTDRSRMHAIAVGLDAPINRAWKITCFVSKLNTDSTKWVDWVYSTKPVNTKLFMMDGEMDPDIAWTSVLSAISMSPDALFARAMQLYEIFYKSVPVAVNSPRLSVAWQNYLANHVSEMDDRNRSQLLATMEDFNMYQQQLGSMGGERESAASTPASNQSPNTPFNRPSDKK